MRYASAIRLAAMLACMPALVAACGSSGTRVEAPRAQPVTTQTASAAAAPVKLTAEQLITVEASVKKMIINPASAKFTRARGMTIAGKPGVHVCGHVTYKGADGKMGQAQPYYLQLGQAEGKPVAERGQVGTDPAALSKVNFMCRERYPS